MIATLSPITELKAQDLMSRNVISVPQKMSLRAAATMLNQSHISGAPIVDDKGRCIGVLSLRDVVKWLDQGERAAKRPDRSHACIYADWEMVNVESVPTDEVNRYMTTDVVTASPETSIGELAQTMLDAQIHRLIITDYSDRVVGVVSSTDILAALARHCRQEEE
jgi:predicted transcriptional regulator